MEILLYILQLKFILLISGITCLLIGIKIKKLFFKQIFYSLMSVFFTLFIFEFIIWNEKEINYENSGEYTEGEYFDQYKEYIGYGPKNDGSFSSIKKINNDTIYSVTYTIKNKIRNTPNSDDSSDIHNIFLGCSQVFGEGLNDDQTFPYFFNENLKIKSNTRNYGFHGYGPHHALSLLENFIINDKLFSKKPKNINVFYSYIDGHEIRAAGLRKWDLYGPRYDVENGNIIYKGGFNHYSNFNHKFLSLKKKVLWNSNIYKFLILPQLVRKNEDKNLERAMYLLKKMHDILSSHDINFYLIVDTNTNKNLKFMNFLQSNKIKNLCLQCEIDDFEESEEYNIIGDGHYSEKYNKTRAKLLYENIKFK